MWQVGSQVRSRKALPVRDTELTVTAIVPVDVTVRVCSPSLLRITFPNENASSRSLSGPPLPHSVAATPIASFPRRRLQGCRLRVVLTAVTFAVNVALVAVAGTMTDAGTLTALVLLPRDTLTPPVGAEPDRVTLQDSVADPVNELLAHERLSPSASPMLRRYC